jgi:sugar phosphate isomerase/epimerase
VKDGIRDGGPAFGWTMTDVGDGDIAFEPFFCGLEVKDHHYLVERDTAPDNPAGSFSTAERSYEYLAGLRERRS